MSDNNKTVGTPTKAKSTSPDEENPITPPRPRILCPGCKNELTIHGTLGTNEASMFANAVDMGKLGLECKIDSCPIYIDGTPNVPAKVAANPNIVKYVQMAKMERDAIEAAKKKAQEEIEAAEYEKYNPFAGAAKDKVMEAEAARIQQRLADDQNVVANQWQLLVDGVQANIKKANEEEARRSRKE